MTGPAILEALARAIHCHDGRLPTPWDADMIARWPDDCEYERKVAMSQAAAVLELVGPKPLLWASIPITKEHEGLAGLWLCSWGPLGQYQVHMFDTDPSHVMLNGPDIVPTGIHGTLEAAQAAAQAHADAAHWANTNIGGE